MRGYRGRFVRRVKSGRISEIKYKARGRDVYEEFKDRNFAYN
jgi:hypothetical protein